MATEGTFALADIGGYTKFLSGVDVSTKVLRETFLEPKEFCETGKVAARESQPAKNPA